MKKTLFTFLLLSFLASCTVYAQEPLKPRADAFPPKPETFDGKAIQMASTVEEMAGWDRYPTYDTYLAMMQNWAENYPDLCYVDTIGKSVQGRLILSMFIRIQTVDDMYRPQFFYTSTMHGDEVTGYVMMLRLIDTLLKGYGNNPQYTNLINSTQISINPLSNPDGTYRFSNNTIHGCMRYNANWVDLNRNFPDPFGSEPMDPQQVETKAMIDYAASHNFRLSANLHGGAEVMNYPWDSFTSYENPHPDQDWWIEVCKRFVDTSRNYSNSHFLDTYYSGYTAGGDWYVIPNGRQDYMNYYHNCRELTMEISSDKTLDSEQLPEYWRFLQHSLVNYIAEIHDMPSTEGIDSPNSALSSLRVYPNPTSNRLYLHEPSTSPLVLYDMRGSCMMQFPAGTSSIDLSNLPQGVYVLHSNNRCIKVIKQ